MSTFIDTLVDLYGLQNKGASINETMMFVFEHFKDFVHFDLLEIAILSNDQQNICLRYVCNNEKVEMTAGRCSDLQDNLWGSVLRTGKVKVISHFSEFLNSEINSIHVDAILNHSVQSCIICPLVSNDQRIGIAAFYSKSAHIYDALDISLLTLVSNNLAICIEKRILIDDLILSSIIGFARIVESKDSDTGQHIIRVQSYAKIIASKLSEQKRFASIINAQFIDDIYKYSSLHDIGKVGIPDGILLKPGKLTIQEFEVMKKHTEIGADILKKANDNFKRNGKGYFDMGIEIAIGHHERFNGKGYPFGLKKGQIPLAARIVAVADVLDALTSRRIYKQAYPLDKALNMILEEKGESFAPCVVNALIDSKDEIKKIYDEYGEQ